MAFILGGVHKEMLQPVGLSYHANEEVPLLFVIKVQEDFDAPIKRNEDVVHQRVVRLLHLARVNIYAVIHLLELRHKLSSDRWLCLYLWQQSLK